MLILPEPFKGIIFIQIINLPENQKGAIQKTLGGEKIIKILKGSTLLEGCVQYDDYREWYVTFKKEVTSNPSVLGDQSADQSFNLAFE